MQLPSLTEAFGPLLEIQHRSGGRVSVPALIGQLNEKIQFAREGMASRAAEQALTTEPHTIVHSTSKIMSTLAPMLAVGTPALVNDPEKVRHILDAASVITAIPTLGVLLSKAVRATAAYKSLPSQAREKYLEKVLPGMTSALMEAITPLLMLQGAKLVLPPGAQPKVQASQPQQLQTDHSINFYNPYLGKQ